MKRILSILMILTSLLVFNSCEEDLCLNAPECINGTCNPQTGNCECDTGWLGEDCNIAFCDPLECDGMCDETTGDCLPCIGNTTGIDCADCLPGYTGVDCELLLCDPETCAGICNPATGDCDPCTGNFTGIGCVECLEGWTGVNCDIDICSTIDCGDNGTCLSNGSCLCDAGWAGESCNCNTNNATIVYDIYGIPTCDCNEGWTGADCNTPIVVNNPFLGVWNCDVVCGYDTYNGYDYFYQSTITSDNYGTYDLQISNFGGFGVTVNAFVTGNNVVIPSQSFYIDIDGTTYQFVFEGNGNLNYAGDIISVTYTYDNGIYLESCTDDWILTP